MSFLVSESLKNKISIEDLEVESNHDESFSIKVGDVCYKLKSVKFDNAFVNIEIKTGESQAKRFLKDLKNSKIYLDTFTTKTEIKNENLKIKSIVLNEKENLFILQILINKSGDKNV